MEDIEISLKLWNISEWSIDHWTLRIHLWADKMITFVFRFDQTVSIRIWFLGYETCEKGNWALKLYSGDSYKLCCLNRYKICEIGNWALKLYSSDLCESCRFNSYKIQQIGNWALKLHSWDLCESCLVNCCKICEIRNWALKLHSWDPCESCTSCKSLYDSCVWEIVP